MSTEPSFDADAITKLQQLGGPKFVVEMIDLFFQYVPQKIAEAQAAEQAGNLEAVRQAVHPIKSSANTIGARQVKQLATQLEQLASQKQATAIPPLLRQLEVAYAEVKTHLEKQRRDLEQ